MPEEYWAAIILIGLLSIPFRLEKTAYRYASIYPRDHRSNSAFGSGVDLFQETRL